MDRSYVPITTFYKHCIPAARQNGYRFVMCLLAREADIENLYPKLEKQWYSLDDITGKDFLFMFTGKHQEDDANSGIWYYGYEAVALNEFMHSFNRDLKLKYGMYHSFRNRDERARWTPELPEMQTRAISDLKKLFGLSERDIPCIVFTNLHNGVNTVLHITSNNIYGVVKDVCLEIEKLFKKIDELTEEIERLTSIKDSKKFNNYLKLKQYETDLRELADSMVEDKRVLLIEHIENLKMGNGIFCDIICKNLNAYVGLATSLKDADLETFERIIKIGEPEHSLNNLQRLYARADSIISSVDNNGFINAGGESK